MHIGKLETMTRNEFIWKRYRRADSLTMTTFNIIDKVAKQSLICKLIWNEGVISAKINTEMHHTDKKKLGVQTNVKSLKSIQSTELPRPDKC